MIEYLKNTDGLMIRNNLGQFIKGSKISEEMKLKLSQNNSRIWLGKKFSEEHKRKLSESHKKNNGIIINNYCIDCLKKIDIRSKKCRSCSKRGHPVSDRVREILRRVNLNNKNSVGRKATPETIEKLRRNNWDISGEKNPNWQGGKTKLSLRLRHLSKYLIWRSKIFERDNWTCQTCHKRGVYLEAHHIKKFSLILKEYNIKNQEEALSCKKLWDVNNGVTLCKDCHKLTRK